MLLTAGVSHFFRVDTDGLSNPRKITGRDLIGHGITS